MPGFVRPLLLAMGAIVASFVLTLWLSQRRLSDIEAQVYQVATIAAPSVVDLDSARSELERMGLYAEEYVASAAAHLEMPRAPRELALAAQERMRHDLAAYERLPRLEGEEPIYGEVKRRLASIDEATARIFERTGAGDFGAARAELAGELLPDIERASAMFKSLIDIQTADAMRELSAIRASRRSAATLALVCGSVSILLSLLAAAIALRALTQAARRQHQVDDEHRARLASQDALRRRDQFLSLAAHELRTPMTSLQLAVAALMRKPERASPRLLSVAERQVRRMNDLLEELVQVVQIDLGSLAIVRDSVDLSDLVRARIGGKAADIAQSGSAVSIHAEGPLVGRWDAAALGRAVDKLLANAIKFGQGKPVEVEVAREADHARLRVRDRGIGIAAESIDSVFDRYARGVSERHYPGLGLGLFIARSIVEAHGGSIRAESGAAGGTVITVSLPLEQRAA